MLLYQFDAAVSRVFSWSVFKKGRSFGVQGSGFRVVVAASLQYIWGDARREMDSRFPVWNFQSLTARPRMTKISRFARNDDTK